MRSAFAWIVILCSALPVYAQTMKAHYPDRTVPLSLADLDSVTYSDEVMGAPASIQLSVNRRAEDAGGAVWLLSAAALVLDQHGQPAEDGIEVGFSINTEDADIGDGLTGNESVFEQTIPGVAFSSLRYHSNLSHQPVRLIAHCETEDGFIRDTLFVTLPGQDPVGVMSVSPANFHFDQEAGDYAVFELNIYVYDGHQHLIGGMAHISPQFGRIYETDTVPPVGEQSPWAEIGEGGVATRYLVVHRSEAFRNPALVESSCRVDAEIPGFPGTRIESFTIFLYQNGGGGR